MSLYNKQPITSGGFDNQSFLVVRNEKSRKARVGRLNQANPDRSIPVGLAATVLNYGLSVELNRQCGAVSGFEVPQISRITQIYDPTCRSSAGPCSELKSTILNLKSLGESS